MRNQNVVGKETALLTGKSAVLFLWRREEQPFIQNQKGRIRYDHYRLRTAADAESVV